MKNLKMLLAVAALASSTAFSVGDNVTINFADGAEWDSAISGVSGAAVVLHPTSENAKITLGSSAHSDGHVVLDADGVADYSNASLVGSGKHIELKSGSKLNVSVSPEPIFADADAAEIAATADVDLDALSGSALVTLTGSEFTLKDLSANTGGVDASAAVKIAAATKFPVAALSTFGGEATVSVAPTSHASAGSGNKLQFNNITASVNVDAGVLAAATDMYVTPNSTINIGSTKWSQGFIVGTYGEL
ncbi:MAG: hypothetical protein ACK4V2_07465 [Pseudomonadota bacterium]|jgi:hypothetical protein|nr:hypothetical protein [Alphaproteobacteria bacterium]